MRCSIWEYWGRAILARIASMWGEPRGTHRKGWRNRSTFEYSAASWARMAHVIAAMPPVDTTPVATVAEPGPRTIGGRAQQVHFGGSITQELARFFDTEVAA